MIQEPAHGGLKAAATLVAPPSVAPRIGLRSLIWLPLE